MATNFLTKIFGSRNDRLIKQYRKTVALINALETEYEALGDDQLCAKTQEFRDRVAQGQSLDDLLPEAFAVVREGSKRVMKMRHFDVQMVGGIALHIGKIAEMGTGEGKTLTATLPVYLNALSGKGVHVVTVNDYLANRDAQWMGKLYNFLGLTVGINLPQLAREEKQAAYQSDITYGTNNEYGFDYLRDNMVYEGKDRVQRGLNYAIVDEVDSILIDEARTPLIISAEQGHENAERILAEMGLIPAGASLYDPANITLMHHLSAALRANHLYHRDQHYVLQEGEIVIVDEFTGRLMSGRRWSDGLHQAVEAKEGVAIQAENQTMASITFQNYFRLYSKLGGMTGTADTEAYEFQEIYGLETVVVPHNQKSQRQDQLDRVYKTSQEKYQAAIDDIRECHERGQPVLVGTTSIENSELISELLTKANLPHQVLNAKQHAREADIVAQAGRPGMITIATNMAGRGTDIVLGGNIQNEVGAIEADDVLDAATRQTQVAQLRAQWQPVHEQVKALGGLRIIATERHESRRIDNQLRGRSGRQGDPGSSRFYLSLDDPLMRIFAGDRVRAIMDRLKMPEGEAIEAGIVTRSIESAQRKVEARNFDVRKQLLEYDDVSNDQRKVIYQQRNDILDATELDAQIAGLREGSFTDLVRQFVPEETVEEQWDLAALERVLADEWQINLALRDRVAAASAITDEEILEAVLAAAHASFTAKLDSIGVENFVPFERVVLLQSIDTHWREHLSALDYLRQGIHLRGYAQKQPKQEYKREAFELFGQLLDAVKNEVTRVLMNVKIESGEQIEQAAQVLEERAESISNVTYTAPDETGQQQTQPQFQSSLIAPVGRNEPCPCGSGKKYKHCHGKLA
ncbi:MAG: preprotein translocase subunit SecA [Burkholderiales bacterium]|nr:preprotein translocase subunit SecA [Burkholderiales bacterium]